MNTISSLFNWLGNLVGADPSTMTTTSKTIVGAINEVDGETSSLDTRVTALESVDTDSLTGGLINSSWSIRKVGSQVYLYMGDIKAFGTGSITILSVGGIPEKFRPKTQFNYSVTPRGTYNSRNMGIAINTNGAITAYNYGSASSAVTLMGDTLIWTTE